MEWKLMNLNDMTEEELFDLKMKWWKEAIVSQKMMKINRLGRERGDVTANYYFYRVNDLTTISVTDKVKTLVTHNGQVVCNSTDKLFIPGKWFETIEDEYDKMVETKHVQEIVEHSVRKKELINELTINLPVKDDRTKRKDI